MKSRALWITAGTIAVLLIISLVAGTQWFQSYLRGNEFLALVSRLTGSAFHAVATVSPVTWTGSSAYSEEITLTGEPGSALRNIEARQIRAEVNWRAALNGAWRVEEISITRLTGDFGFPTATPGGTPAVTDTTVNNFPLAAWLPKRFELGRARVADTEINFANIRAAGVALTVTPEGRGWRIEGSGGTLTIPSLPEFKILDFRAREQGGDFFLSGGNFGLGDSGRLTASGTTADGASLRTSWTGINASEILGETWKNRLSGVFSGSATINASEQVEGTMTLTDGRFENIPLLGVIADFTGQPSFRRAPLQEMEGKFAYRDDTLAISDFHAESKGLFRIEGTAKIAAGGALDGIFEIGVTPQTLQWLPGSRERVFETARDGYLWTTVRVGGTIERPTENLSARLAEAMGTAVIEQGAGVIKGAPDTAVDGVRRVIDILRPLVP